MAPETNIRASTLAAEKFLDLSPTLQRRAWALVIKLMHDPDFGTHADVRAMVGWAAVALSRAPDKEDE